MATLKKSAYEVAVRKQEQFLFKNTREKNGRATLLHTVTLRNVRYPSENVKRRYKSGLRGKCTGWTI